MLVIENFENEALTTRWPPTPAAANWKGGERWREESFLSQGMAHEPPWSVISSSSPVVLMITTTSPRSCPGTQLLSPGKRPETLLWRDTTMPPLPFRIRLLVVKFKGSENNRRYNWPFSLVNLAGGAFSRNFFQVKLVHSTSKNFYICCTVSNCTVKSIFKVAAQVFLILLWWPIKTYTEDKLIQKWFNDDILVAMWIHQCMGRFGVNGIWILIDLYTCCINFKQSPTKLQTSAFQLMFKIWTVKTVLPFEQIGVSQIWRFFRYPCLCRVNFVQLCTKGTSRASPPRCKHVLV